MPLEIVRAITAEAHRHSRLVAAHPTNNEGALTAVNGGIDILLHTTPDGGQPWDSAFVHRLLAAKVAVAPTLKLWHWELARANVPDQVVARFAELAEQQIGAFAKAGGDVVFGTDVGYMADYDPAAEYDGLIRAGLVSPQILAALTTTPARRLGDESHRGRLAAGFDADLVLLDGRPDRDATAWTRVKYVWRAGKPLYRR
jgi:imidazolonepropionase-like amidohydrolase